MPAMLPSEFKEKNFALFDNKKLLLSVSAVVLVLHGVTGVGITTMALPAINIPKPNPVITPLEVSVMNPALPNVPSTNINATTDTPEQTISIPHESQASNQALSKKAVIEPKNSPENVSKPVPAPVTTMRPTIAPKTPSVTRPNTAAVTHSKQSVSTTTSTPATNTHATTSQAVTNNLPNNQPTTSTNSNTSPTTPTVTTPPIITKPPPVVPTITTLAIAKKPPTTTSVSNDSPVTFSSGQASWKKRPPFDCNMDNVTEKKFTVIYMVNKQGGIISKSYSSSGIALLDKKLKQQADAAAFHPQMKNGQPVEGKVIVPITCP